MGAQWFFYWLCLSSAVRISNDVLPLVVHVTHPELKRKVPEDLSSFRSLFDQRTGRQNSRKEHYSGLDSKALVVVPYSPSKGAFVEEKSRRRWGLRRHIQEVQQQVARKHDLDDGAFLQQKSGSKMTSKVRVKAKTDYAAGNIKNRGFPSTKELTRCVGVRCSYNNKDTARGKQLKLKGRTDNAICITVCETPEDDPDYWQNHMMYDYWAKQVKVRMDDKNHTWLCWMIDLNGILIAAACDPNNAASQTFQYDEGTEQFYQNGQCLDMMFEKEKGRTKNDTQPGGQLNGCDVTLKTQHFILPKKSIKGPLDQAIQGELQRQSNSKQSAYGGYQRPCNNRIGISDPSQSQFYPLKASSEAPDAPAGDGRLNKDGNGWCAAVTDEEQWLQVDFASMMVIVAFEVQAGAYNPAKYVKTLTLRYKSYDDGDWTDLDGGTALNVDTNGVAGRVSKVTLPTDITVKSLRLQPATWEEGICMRIEAFGCSSWTGDPGERGDQGPPGLPGPDGPPGVDGAPGEPAPRGAQGEPGPMGPAGVPGNPGPVGSAGPTGDPGSFGDPGLTGPQGYDGPRGAQGDRGLPGRAGPPGNKIQGRMGVVGRKGWIGPAPPGPDGAPGKDGNPGKPGVQGAPGVPGDPGRDGPAGLPGIMGYHGTRGFPGANGRPGKPGPPGAPGLYPVETDLDTTLYNRIISLQFDIEHLEAQTDELAIDTANAVGVSPSQVLAFPVPVVAAPTCPPHPTCWNPKVNFDYYP